MRYLLDTDICIYSIKRRPPEVVERLSIIPQGVTAISTVTQFELWHGVFKSTHVKLNTAALQQFQASLVVLPFDSRDAEACGEILAGLEQRGLPIGPYDLQIAAQARTRGLVLVTHNTREFSRVPGLVVEDWTKPAR